MRDNCGDCGRPYRGVGVSWTKCYEITRDGRGPIRIRLWSDWQEYQRLITRFFGLRILITDRAEWSAAQVIEAYRGQSKVEAAFRDLKDPACSPRGHNFTG